MAILTVGTEGEGGMNAEDRWNALGKEADRHLRVRLLRDGDIMAVYDGATMRPVKFLLLHDDLANRLNALLTPNGVAGK